MEIKEISVGVSKKYSVNYNSVEVSLSATAAVENDDYEEAYAELFSDLNEKASGYVQQLLDGM